jgi:CHAT domain-containing protein/tetratricopeptide (TPR) repeat protein
MSAVGGRNVETTVYGRWLANLILPFLIAGLLCFPSSKSAAQMPQAPTFQWKDAKTPAESVDSINLLERALELTQTALGSEDSVVGELAYRLGQRHADAGDYERALRLFEQSLAIREKALGPEHPDVSDCLNDLASVYEELQNYDEALSLYKRSLAIAEKAYGKEHPEVAITLCNMADTYREKSAYAEALRVGQRSLQIREKVFGSEHPDVADSLITLAAIYRDMGDSAQALQMAERSLAIMKKSLRPDHPLVAECLYTLAEIQKDRRNFGQALLLHQRALVINEKISGPEHPDVFRSLSSLAELYAITGDLQRSISTLADLSSRQRRYLARHFQTSSWMVASRVADLFRSTSEIFQTLCAAEETNKTNSIAADAAESSALSKAFWEEVQAAHAALEADQQIKTGELYSQYQSLQSQLTRLPEIELDQGKRDSKRVGLEAAMSRVVGELAQRVGLVAQRILEQSLTLTVIGRELPTESALVDVIQYRRYDFAAKTNQWKEQRYAVYLTFPLANDSTNVVVKRVDLGEAAPINEAVELVCKRMSANPPQYRARDLPAALQKLSQLVYAPLAPHLTNVSHLIICPDGQLSRLPFEMLPVGNKFLIEEKTISYVTSGREVVRLANQSNSKPKTQNSKSLVMGNPDFDFDLGSARVPRAVVAVPATTSTNKLLAQRTAMMVEETDMSGATPDTTRETRALHATRSLSRSYRGMKFNPLPGSGVEATNVAKLLGGDAILRLGADAREAELKAVVSPRVLHLATHGFFLSDQEFKHTNSGRADLLVGLDARQRVPTSQSDWENPLVRCGIALAGANHALQITNAIAEDGLLTGLEASLLNLQGTELVILSACDSGTGEVKIGEGVMSLRRAFRIAGAESVLASHWPVSDRATSRLMTEFMQRWRSGEPRAQAWRAAQSELLHSKDFSNPYFWAAFTLTGQWRQ